MINKLAKTVDKDPACFTCCQRWIREKRSNQLKY